MHFESNEIPAMVDARKLVVYTLKITQNLNNFPKKYRFTLVDKIVCLSMNIFDHVSDANLSWGRDRINQQNEAIKCCRKLKFYLQCVYEVLKPQCSIPYWSSMVDNIEKQLIGWRSSTMKLFKRNN